MDTDSIILEVSELNSPSCDMEEPASATLDNPILLADGEDLLFDDTRIDNPATPTTIIPETPSPRCVRTSLRTRQQLSNASQSVATAASASPPASWGRSPPVGRHSKRRLLDWSATLNGHAVPATSWRTTECVPLSSLLGSWMEPLPPAAAPSASSPPSSSLGAPPPSQECVASTTVDPGPPDVGAGRKRAPKRVCSSKPISSSSPPAGSSKPRSRASASSARPSRRSPGSHRTGITSLPTSTEERAVPLSPVEEIVITDGEEDDFLVQAMVQAIQVVEDQAMVQAMQVVEDEAFARSLQSQIDREEELQQRQRAETLHRPSHHHHHHRPSQHNHYHHYHNLWDSPYLLSMDGFTPTELLDGRHRGRGRTRSRRVAALREPYVEVPNLDDYEALLDFEERQGAVAKRGLTERQRLSLPTKTYSLVHSAGKTRCQICFSDYTEGEQLRILPCLHDYHLECIDRWLEQSTTCPICRSEVHI